MNPLRRLKGIMSNPEGLKVLMPLREMYLRRVVPLDFPIILNVDPCNRCNLLCKMCPYPTSERTKGNMPFELFRKIADECTKHPRLFRLFLVKDGEPLLNPELPRMIAYAKKLRIARTVSVVTNGTALTEKKSQELIESGLDDIGISIDASSPETYKEIKGHDMLPKLEENVRTFLAVRRRMGRKNPFVRLKFIVMPENRSELEPFMRRWEKLGDALNINPLHDWAGVQDNVKAEGPFTRKSGRYPCALLWYTMVVNWDGVVSPCCIDYHLQEQLGDVSKQSLWEVWNGAEMRRLRDVHVSGCYEKSPLCAGCSYWRIKENIGGHLQKQARHG